MTWTAQEYLDRMQQTRAAHLRNIDTTGKRIQGIYMQAAKDLAQRAAQAKDGSLTERWANDYQRALEKRLEQMRGELGLAIRGGMRASARLPGQTVEAWLNDALALCGVDGSFTGILSSTPDEALRALLDGRMYRDGKSLSRRIWDKTAYLQGNIEDIVAQGIAQHRSALELAHDLEAYVNPKAKMPVSWLKLYPDIPFDRQIDYNAQRLARTAINHAYWAAGIETAQRNPFCEAMHWQLSPSHFERQVARFGEDVCDTYASHDEGLGRGNWPIRKVPMPHAQCLCATWQVVPPIRDVADRLGKWVDGGEDAELEKAFGEWRENSLTAPKKQSTIKMTAQSQPVSPEQRRQEERQKALDEIWQQPWMQGLKSQDRAAILRQMERFDDDELAFWRRNAGMIQGDFYYDGGTAHYSPYGRRVNLNLSEKNAKSARMKTDTNLITFFHETGHLFDYQAFGGASLRYSMPELDKKLRADYLAYAKELLKQKGLGTIRGLGSLTYDQWRALVQDLSTDPHLKSSVSDIVGGLTKTKLQGMWGHPASYWKTRKPSTEAVAHMFEAKYMKGERLEVFKKYFPNSYQYFEDSIAGR